MDFAETLAALLAEIPAAMRAPAAFASVLRRSDELLDLPAIAGSWFEDDPEVARVVKQLGRRSRAKGATYLLQTVISRRRERWAEIVLRTALWMREAPLEENLCWRELGLVAKAIAGGRDLSDIGLMRDVAGRLSDSTIPRGGEEGRDS